MVMPSSVRIMVQACRGWVLARGGRCTAIGRRGRYKGDRGVQSHLLRGVLDGLQDLRQRLHVADLDVHGVRGVVFHFFVEDRRCIRNG
jgi:hypothetical protein